MFRNDYDGNGNRKAKKFKNGSINKYIYNIENKMVQVTDADTTYDEVGDTRISDMFYHLDGSRMWEGMLDLSDLGKRIPPNYLSPERGDTL